MRQGFFYGWVVVAVVFATILVSAGVRAAPGVFIRPLEQDLGWGVDAISFAVSMGLLLHGMTAPFAGRLTDRFGPRRTMLVGLLLLGASTVISAGVTALWQLTLFWGLLSGVGSGVATAVLGATVANRWFVARRGLVLGLFGAAGSAGQLIFVPLLMGLVVTAGWRMSMLGIGLAALVIFVPVLVFMRDDPADVGQRPLGAQDGSTARPSPPPLAEVMGRAVRTPEFWLLSGSFFICGATSNGIVGTHFIPHSIDHGIPAVTAASALALMGSMNFIGTLVSGWLTDRVDPRKLLAVYYTFRGLSLLLLPFMTEFSGLAIFAIVFGLDYIATVPPTAALAADVLGRRNVGTVFGWVFFAHQVGAALLAYLGGVTRSVAGDYMLAFLAAGLLAMLGGALAMQIDRRPATIAVAS
jgi:MFS family permease